MNIFSKYPNSKFLSELPTNFINMRERVADLFPALDGLEDPNFSTALDTDPLAHIWEMMVATILKRSDLSFRDSGGHGPDFVVENRGRRIFVEATTASFGEEGKPDTVPRLEASSSVQTVPVDKMLLRISQALFEKKKKFIKYREDGIVSVSDSCVIAISSMKLPQRNGFSPCLGVSATLGYGSPYMIYAAKSGRRVDEGFQLQKDIRKTSEKPLPVMINMRPFIGDEYSDVAGVLYSDASPYSAKFALNEESYFIHNPKAKQGVPVGTFKTGHELWTVISSIGDLWKTYDLGFAAENIIGQKI